MEPLLLEHTDEVDLLAGLAGRAAGGAGAVALISGPEGIGKSTLLAAGAERAEAAGLNVLAATAGEAERDLAWGVVRQLFGRELHSPERRANALEGAAVLAAPALGFGTAHSPADALGATLHGLHWLAANLAASQPLLIAVDDAHWCDPPSLRWLTYLAPRVGDLPVLLVVASCSEMDLPGTTLHPAPLSVEAASELIAATIGSRPAPEFAAACHSATGGNPFLLRELATELADASVAPTAANAARAGAATPASVTDSLRRRLALLPDPMQALCRAVAVLGDGCRLRSAAALADLDEDAAAEAADALADAHILSPGLPLAFRHPVVRDAVHAGLPPVVRARAHARAAALRGGEGADDDAVAVHLLATEPGGDPGVVDRLRRAAAAALGRGAPETAVAQLRRALAEDAPGGDRGGLLRELGEAELQLGDPAGASHLAAAVQAAEDARSRAQATLPLAQVTALSGAAPDAVELLDGARLALGGDDPEIALRLEVEAIDAARQDFSTSAELERRVAAVRERVNGDGPTERLLLVHMAMHSAMAGDSAATTVELAERGLAGKRLIDEQGAASPACYVGIHALVTADRADLALEHLGAALDDAHRRGSAVGMAIASLCRSHAHHARGAVPDAIADGRVALDSARAAGWSQMVPWALAFLVDALLERGDLEDAAAEVQQSGLTGDLPFTPDHEPLIRSRARLALALGDPAAAERDLLAVGPRLTEAGVRNPAMSAWRSTAALALAAQDRLPQAHRLVEEELALARRYGAPRAVAVALRTASALQRGPERIATLEEAVAVLSDSPADLERARCLVELGAALRRANRRAQARQPLVAGLELATGCGATATVTRAQAELAAAGVQRRAQDLTGAATLTAGELRVARLAAAGATNREIAEALFVSLRTVETHLTHAYSKLGIAGRRELAAAL